MARLALVFSGGAALAFLPGRFSIPALVAVLLALRPIPASRRPGVRLSLGIALVAGIVAASASAEGWLGGGSEGPGDRTHASAPTSLADARRPAVGGEGGWASQAQAWREALARRLTRLYGDQAAMVSALTLARRDGLDPAVREAFARSGTAHILAISGFHVGVIAGVMVVLLRLLGLSRRRVGVAAAIGAWLYVALLGFPDAASRAALILTVVAAARARGRPAARWGGLGLAFLLMVAHDPARLLSPGFQLSFAGAAGLMGWAAPMTRELRDRWWCPSALASPVAAGVAATVATLPIVAWHFERVSLVGIPATLVATPLVVVALPGAIFSLLADIVHPGAGSFLAGGVGVLLGALSRVTATLSAPDWASVWVPRGWVTVATAGALAAAGAAPWAHGRAGRRLLWAGALAGILAWPGLLALQARGTAEIVMVDVGQGDALAVRTPGGRWILVDAGPPWRGDPKGAPVVRALRRRGVTRLEALVLTHPDLDHIGGAGAILAAFDVAQVLDPAHAVGKGAYRDLLEAAARRGTPWRRALEGQAWEVDGVVFRVLHPVGAGRGTAGGGDTEANDVSVVLGVTFGSFDALLTGDAPTAVEEAILPRVSTSLEVLKVGHHGSRTSTHPSLLARGSPEVALLSVGRRNRYGHPDPSVLRRLREGGASIRRTDEEGTVRVMARKDGSYQVESEGPSRR